MSTASIDFSPGLSYFLRRDLRGREVVLNFKEHQSIKHLVESLGIPHTEIGPVWVNGEQKGLGTLARDGDRIRVQEVENHCPVDPAFILDGHLGRLTAYLRMLGFDCLYRVEAQDDELAKIAHRENRILLTRDRRLLMRKVVDHGYCLRSLQPRQQLLETVRRFDLAGRIDPFRRCLRCNQPLEHVSKELILDRLEPLTKKYFNDFRICPACAQIYWKGSHYDRMLQLIDASLGKPI